MKRGLRALGFSARNINDKKIIVGVLLREFIIEGITVYLIDKNNYSTTLKERILKDKYYIQAHIILFDDEYFEQNDLNQIIVQLGKQSLKTSELRQKNIHTKLESLAFQACSYANIILNSLNSALLNELYEEKIT
ncbi:MAG: hypothetical protein ACP5GU_05285 [Thermoprotei archaeon]|jgi:hypothetical protein